MVDDLARNQPNRTSQEWPAMRVGRKVGRTLYLARGDDRDNDVLVGLVDSDQLAAEIADRWNEYGSAYATE